MSSPDENDKRYEALGEALRRAEERARIFVPPTLEEAILKNAREHFEGAPTNPRVSWRRWWIFGVPAFAAIVIAFLVFNHRAPQLAREDINRDGRVDILDALALARAVEGKTNNERLDQNGDRQLDDADVRAVALAAVRLDRKPGT
jgi:hypothetical protein